MSELSQVLDKVRKKIARHQGKGITEADTKIAMIDPVLRALGWEVGNLDEVSLEYRKTPTDDPVDYALFLQGKVKLFVEAKALGQKVGGGKWANQIMGYAGVAGVKWVVLTNGDEYRIYNACVEAPFDEKLLYAVRLTDPNSPTESTLDLLSKQRMGNGDIENIWQQLFADRQVLAALQQLFSLASTKTLTHYVKKHVKGLTSKEIHAGLLRVCTQVRFPAEITIPSPDSKGSVSRKSLVDTGIPIPSADSKGSVSLKSLIDVGVLQPGILTREYKGIHLQADLLPSGAVRFQGKDYESCSAAGEAAKYSVIGKKMKTNGWSFWHYQNANGKLVPLIMARREYERKQK